jgi:hypothetical protein
MWSGRGRSYGIRKGCEAVRMSRTGVCSIGGCNKSIYSKGLCRTHYMESWKIKWDKYAKPVERVTRVKNSSKFGVYKIECNGECYIGGTAAAFHLRWRNHLHELRKGKHHNHILQEEFNKYGEKSFKFSILEVINDRKDVVVVEQKYLDTIKPTLNISPMARRYITDETRRKRLLYLKKSVLR